VRAGGKRARGVWRGGRPRRGRWRCASVRRHERRWGRPLRAACGGGGGENVAGREPAPRLYGGWPRTGRSHRRASVRPPCPLGGCLGGGGRPRAAPTQAPCRTRDAKGGGGGRARTAPAGTPAASTPQAPAPATTATPAKPPRAPRRRGGALWAVQWGLPAGGRFFADRRCRLPHQLLPALSEPLQ